jgi:histidinol-phosphate aminotransferase
MSRFFQPHIAGMSGYLPGEQPQNGGFVKLNTNENPYPPSPRVGEAIARAIAANRLRLYPDPLATSFCETAARLHGVSPQMVMAGNGSDDLLTIVTRAFAGPGEVVVYPSPSYILYRTLIKLQNARPVEVEFTGDWTLDAERFAPEGASLAYLANPNSPSGTMLSPDEVAELASELECPLVVDEAYVDFADSNALGLLKKHPNLIVTRSLSKGYSLAGLRIGYLLAQPEVVEGLIKVKDSYNCDTLSLVGAIAALEDQAYHSQTRSAIIATRKRLTEALRGFGYTVPESQANFVWCTGGPPAGSIYEALKARQILVRLMRYPGYDDGLRVTVGTDAEIDQLLDVWRTLV